MTPELNSSHKSQFARTFNQMEGPETKAKAIKANQLYKPLAYQDSLTNTLAKPPKLRQRIVPKGNGVINGQVKTIKVHPVFNVGAVEVLDSDRGLMKEVPEKAEEHNVYDIKLVGKVPAEKNAAPDQDHFIPGVKEMENLDDAASVPENVMPDFNPEKILNRNIRLKIDQSLRHDKWIVVTSIMLPTPDVIFLSKIPGWKVLVVGDTKTPANWSQENCIYISVPDQESFGATLTSKLPYRSYARKNVGYLYAIAHGAKVIYETDDDNRPLDLLTSFELEPTMSGLMFAGSNIFNPYHHFGQSTLWPRGYPLGSIGSAPQDTYRLSESWRTPVIQQGVVNGDPDMDAIFRLTRKRTESRLEVTFDPSAPPAIVPEGVFSPFNSQNTLFKYEALWAMLLPTTTTFRMCDIWRGYWAQRLLWEINGRLSFFPPNAYQQRNAHSYMADATDEKDMYFHTDRLLKFLTKWICHRNLTFFQCVYKLSFDMAKEDLWKIGDAEITRLWLEDLIHIGYKEPKRVLVTEDELKASQSNFLLQQAYRQVGITPSKEKNNGKDSIVTELEYRWMKTVLNGSFARFTAAQQNPPAVKVEADRRATNIAIHLKRVASLCSRFTNSSTPTNSFSFAQETPSFFHDVLLIVVFNWQYYANIRYLEVSYRNVFPNIVYCGENSTRFQDETSGLETDLTFIEAPVSWGMYGYSCSIKAMQMGYNVSGYLIVGDDVVLNTWNFHDFDKEKIWSNFMVHVFNVNNGTNWQWWNFTVGSQAYQKVMATIKSSLSTPPGVKTSKDFLDTISSNTGGPSNCPHAVNDVYYIPRSLKASAIYYLKLFGSKGLMLELAISMLFYGLRPRQDVLFFSGDNLWLHERVDPWMRYSPRQFFLHPVKFSNSSNIEPYCSKYLKDLLNIEHLHESTLQEANRRKQNFEKLQERYTFMQDRQEEFLQQQLILMQQQKANKDNATLKEVNMAQTKSTGLLPQNIQQGNATTGGSQQQLQAPASNHEAKKSPPEHQAPQVNFKGASDQTEPNHQHQQQHQPAPPAPLPPPPPPPPPPPQHQQQQQQQQPPNQKREQHPQPKQERLLLEKAAPRQKTENPQADRENDKAGKIEVTKQRLNKTQQQPQTGHEQHRVPEKIEP